MGKFLHWIGAKQVPVHGNFGQSAPEPTGHACPSYSANDMLTKVFSDTVNQFLQRHALPYTLDMPGLCSMHYA